MDIIFNLNSPSQGFEVTPPSSSHEEVFPFQPMTNPSSVTVSTAQMDIDTLPKFKLHFSFLSETNQTI